MSPALEVDELSVHFGMRQPVIAVDGVSFSIDVGDTIGLVGESGCGKTTLGRAIVRLVDPTAGTIRISGVDVGSLKRRELRRLRRDMQMVFQDPFASLDPRIGALQTIMEPLLVHGICNRAEAKSRAIEMLHAVQLASEVGDRYPHELSGGQRQRLAIARALILEPKLLVCDEPTSALDVSVQAQVINLLRRLQREFDMTYVFISHDLAVVRYIARRMLVMYLGRIVEEAESEALCARPLHPYTRALVASVLEPGMSLRDGRGNAVAMNLLPVFAPATGCSFQFKCPYVQERCRTESPQLQNAEPGRRVACHFWAEIAEIERQPS